ncbi:MULTISPECIES: OmpA family protein [unclassified Leeuwenhoekiella]|uniref:OmpA family protein n=1 Tax=unclassified Leeuwenhoekiella TaxID=2615029 RepID=UPI000C4F4577|nr:MULTISPECIES: OmpA family protein [unclassified Leeuwenhoekiella]MBA80515.1 hypothetical protein [Leeuwenhoekiella sp.]|tara:strand:+ start:117985 stop:119304 length:1320 start_codon:yes stop_codon:yes gene_type:complete
MRRITFLVLVMALCYSNNTEAQFLKKLTKKLEDKLDRTTKNLEDKADKQVDKILGLDENDSIPSVNGTEMEMDETGTDEMDYPNETADNNQEVGFRAYSKYDFVPGTNLVAFEDFSSDSVGDFPQKWNTNSSAEVVTLNTLPGKWLRIGNGWGTYVFDGIPQDLPDDFTLEFDLLYDFNADTYAFKRYVNVVLSELENPNMYMDEFSYGKEVTTISLSNSASARGVALDKKTAKKGMNVSGNNNHPAFSKAGKSGVPYHIAILKKGSRIKVYVDQDKVLDIPRGADNNLNYRTLRFESSVSPENEYFYLGNVKFATGVESGERLFKNGSHTAYGITFDSGSASIQPASYASIKQIAQAIQSDATGNYLITGHTDSDGDTSLNMPLSESRAEAVKAALVSEFGIDASRLQTAGKGSLEPVSSENTATAKALNRRVTITKL